MTIRPALLILVVSVGCATTPFPTHLSITNLSVGFVTDRRENNRHAGSNDLLFLDLEVANPDHVPRTATVVCIREDDPEHPLKRKLALDPRSWQRHHILGFYALPYVHRIRCRLEPAHTGPGTWTEFIVPGNDSTRPSPIRPETFR